MYGSPAGVKLESSLKFRGKGTFFRSGGSGEGRASGVATPVPLFSYELFPLFDIRYRADKRSPGPGLAEAA